jgi:hypothetical protein
MWYTYFRPWTGPPLSISDIGIYHITRCDYSRCRYKRLGLFISKLLRELSRRNEWNTLSEPLGGSWVRLRSCKSIFLQTQELWKYAFWGVLGSRRSPPSRACIDMLARSTALEQQLFGDTPRYVFCLLQVAGFSIIDANSMERDPYRALDKRFTRHYRAFYPPFVQSKT